MHNQEWLHGTQDEKFTHWTFPPPRSQSKPELFAHSISFLTTDRHLATKAGPLICRSRIRDDAVVLDVINDHDASEGLRQEIAATRLGFYHDHVQNRAYWVEAWRLGLIMRFGSNHPDMRYKLETVQRLAEKAIAGSVDRKHIDAWFSAQNQTRAWIELIGTVARAMGYDALLGNEIDSRRHGGGVACPVLFALTEKALTNPVWE